MNLDDFIKKNTQIFAMNKDGFIPLTPIRIALIMQQTAKATIDAVRPDLGVKLESHFHEFNRKAKEWLGDK